MLFDFDGVLVKRDSTAAFLWRSLRRRPLRLAAAVAPGLVYLVVYRVPTLQSAVARALLRLAMWRRSTHDVRGDLAALAREMAADPSVVSVVVEPALERLREHQGDGDDVVVVSASFTDFPRPWFDAAGIEGVTLIGSGLRRVRWGCAMDPHNRHAHKVAAVRAAGRYEPWEVVYTDSLADLPLLRHARKAVLVDMPRARGEQVRRVLGFEMNQVYWTAAKERSPLTRE